MAAPVTVTRLRHFGWLVSDGEILVTAASKDEAMRRYRAAIGTDRINACGIKGCTERPVAFIGIDLVCATHYVAALYALKERRLTPTRFTGRLAEVV